MSNANPQAADPPAETGRRQQVIEQLRAAALELEDPLAANLAYITANISEIEAGLSGRVLQSLREPSAARSSRTERQFQTYLKCVREIGRFSQLELRIRQSHGRN